MSWIHWVIVLAVVLLLFGRGRISNVMGELGRGIRHFKDGLSETPRIEEKNPDGTSPRVETDKRDPI